MKVFNIWGNFLNRCKNMSAAPLAHRVDGPHRGYGIRCLSGEAKATISGNRIVVEAETVNPRIDKGA